MRVMVSASRRQAQALSSVICREPQTWGTAEMLQKKELQARSSSARLNAAAQVGSGGRMNARRGRSEKRNQNQAVAVAAGFAVRVFMANL